jgi:hypothetical protein
MSCFQKDARYLEYVSSWPCSTQLKRYMFRNMSVLPLFLWNHHSKPIIRRLMCGFQDVDKEYLSCFFMALPDSNQSSIHMTLFHSPFGYRSAIRSLDLQFTCADFGRSSRGWPMLFFESVGLKIRLFKFYDPLDFVSSFQTRHRGLYVPVLRYETIPQTVARSLAYKYRHGSFEPVCLDQK